MSRNPNGRTNLAFAWLCVTTLVVLLALLGHVKTRARPPAINAGDNPNYFVIWETNSSLHYTFTYDPHAADIWLFQSGGQPTGNTNVFSLPRPKWTWTN